MVNFFIYAKDFSGSTHGNAHYHTNGLNTLEQFKSDVEKMKKDLADAGEPPTESRIIYLHWGNECEEVDEEITRRTYLEFFGVFYGTSPQTIIHWLRRKYDICHENSKIRLLYIITDGMIDSMETDICFELNEKMYYESVVYHAFSSDPSSVNLSVAASFLKSRCMIYHNNHLNDSTDIAINFDYDNINVDNFDCEKENLKSYIKLKYLKKFNHEAHALKEVEKLKTLRARLFDELLSKTPERPKVNLETKDKTVFLREFVKTEWYQTLVSPTQEAKVYIEKSITTLINYIVSESKSYSFDALKFRKGFSEFIEEEPIVDVNFTVEQEIAFPDIILDDEKGTPVVILTDLSLLDKLIFHGSNQPASFSKFIKTMECPLFLIDDKDISESIGYFYTLNVYKLFLENNTNTEPRTRKPFCGGLVLADTDLFDRYNDYILSATYFNCRKVKFNVGLLYYVLWKNCENKEWMDKNVIEQFKKYTMRRISKTVCNIGLSSLPLDPQEKTSLLTALWYCVELSSNIFKDDPENFSCERLRMFYRVADCMIEILKYFDYDLDLNNIERRIEIISNVMTLKRIHKHKDKVYYILEKIFKTANGFLVSEIEKPFNLYQLNYLTLSHKKLLPDSVVKETVHLNEYIHLMHFQGDLETSKAGNSTFEICERTCRPFFALDHNKSFYTELVKNTRKVVISNDDDKDNIKVSFEPIDSLEFNKIVSLYNLFINCVLRLHKYPTLSEYAAFVFQRKQFIDDKVTIFPPNVYFDIKNVYSRYEKLMAKVTVSKFIEVCISNVSRPDRIKTEDRVKFNSDDEIMEFISSEELKANLIKITSH